MNFLQLKFTDQYLDLLELDERIFDRSSPCQQSFLSLLVSVSHHWTISRHIHHTLVHSIVLPNEPYNHFVMHPFVYIHPLIIDVFLLYQIIPDEYLELVSQGQIEFVVIFDRQFRIEEKYAHLH